MNADELNAVGGGNGAPTEGFIRKPEVARRLGKKTRTIDNWMRRGLLPYVKAGRSVLFKWEDVEAHLQTKFRVCRMGGGRR
jgi:excisionase family DNA binding protein